MFTKKIYNEKKHLIWFIIIANILAIVFIVIPNDKKTREKDRKWKEQYTYLEEKDTNEVAGILSTKYTEHNYCWVTFKNDEKWGIAFAYNDDYEPDDYMYDFIQPGDSLFKASGSDTMHIYRNDEHYYFVLYERINK